jgi:hypothetical protein
MGTEMTLTFLMTTIWWMKAKTIVDVTRQVRRVPAELLTSDPVIDDACWHYVHDYGDADHDDDDDDDVEVGAFSNLV